MSQLCDRDMFLTINVSALHLRHADFDQRLLRLLETTGVSPQRLIVEVTESSLLDDPDRVRATLDRLRVAGVGAALDDFGTGYSSLSYLHSLPLRMLKIDRAFVHALDDGMHTTTDVGVLFSPCQLISLSGAEGIDRQAHRGGFLRMGFEFGRSFLPGGPGLIGQGGLAERPTPGFGPKWLGGVLQMTPGSFGRGDAQRSDPFRRPKRRRRRIG